MKMGARCTLFSLCVLSLVLSSVNCVIAENATVYKIGAVLPLSGFLQSSGQIYLDAYNMVVDLFNNLNTTNISNSPFAQYQGHDGALPTVQLIVLDDISDANMSVAQMQKLIVDYQVDAILGGCTSEIVAAQAAAANNLTVPYVNGGGAASSIYNSDFPWAFGVMSSIKSLANTEMVMLKDLVFRNILPKPCKFVMLYENSSHGLDFQSGVLSFLNKTENAGYFVLTANNTFPYHQPLWRASQTVDFIVQAYEQFSPDILLVDAHIPEFVQIQSLLLDSVRTQFKLISYGPTGAEMEAVQSLGKGVNGLVYGTWWSHNYANQQSTRFTNLWNTYHRNSTSPPPLDYRAACAYEAVRVLLSAFLDAGTNDKKSVRRSLANMYLKDSLFLNEELLFNPSGQAYYDFAFEQQVLYSTDLSTTIIYPISIKQADPVVFFTNSNVTTSVIVITKNNHAIEIAVAVGGGLFLLLVVAFYLYRYQKTRREVPDLEMASGSESGPASPEPVVPLKRKRTPQGSRMVSKEEFPLLLSNWSLDLGLQGNQAPVDKVISQTITIANNTDHSLRYSFYLPEKTHKAELTFIPAAGKIKKGGSQDIEVNLQFFCTAKWSAQCFVCATTKDGSKRHCPMNIKLESMLSTKLSYDEVIIDGPAIGEGSYGTVYQGEWRGMEVAVKQLKVQEAVTYTEAILSELQREIEIMSTLRHPNIVSFIGASLVPGHLFLVTEFMPLGSLGKYLNPKYILRPTLKMKIALDCARGMAFLHKCNILHRDLKPDNLLVLSMSRNAPINVKLTDFGTARAVTLTITKNTKMTVGLGTPIYMAPEVLGRGTYDEKSDVFSFGVLLYEVCTQTEPYKEFKNSWSVAQFVSEGNRLEIPPTLPPFLIGLISKCWAQEPADRPKFSEVVEELESAVLNRKLSDSQSMTDEGLPHSESKKKAKENHENFVGRSNPSIISGLSSLFNSPTTSSANIDGPILGPRHGPKLQRRRPKNASNESNESGNESPFYDPEKAHITPDGTSTSATPNQVSFVTESSGYSVTSGSLSGNSSHTTNSIPSDGLPPNPPHPVEAISHHDEHHNHSHEHEKLSRINEEGDDDVIICDVCHSKTSSRNNSRTSSKSASGSSKSHSAGSCVRFTLPEKDSPDASPNQETPPTETDSVSSDEETTIFIPAGVKEEMKEESMRVLPSLGADFFFSPNLADARDKKESELPKSSLALSTGIPIGAETGEMRFSKELLQQHSDNALDRSQIARMLVGTEYPSLAGRPLAPPNLEKPEP